MSGHPSDPRANDPTPEAVAAALTDRDFRRAGQLLAHLPQARWPEVAEALSPEVRHAVLPEAQAAAWEQVGAAEAMGPALVQAPDASPLADWVDAVGRAVEGLEAGRDARSSRERLATSAHQMRVAARDQLLQARAQAASVAAMSDDVGTAAREAAAVLRAHRQAPSPEAAAQAAWVVAELARSQGRPEAERSALVTCAAAAEQAGDDRRRAEAMARLEALLDDAR